MASSKRNPNFKKFGTGHTATRCEYCQYWITFLLNDNGKRVPVHEEGLLFDDTHYDANRHVLHFSKCPNQKQRAEDRKALDYCIMPGCTTKVAKVMPICEFHAQLVTPDDIKRLRHMHLDDECPKSLVVKFTDYLVEHIQHQVSQRTARHRPDKAANDER